MFCLRFSYDSYRHLRLHWLHHLPWHRLPVAVLKGPLLKVPWTNRWLEQYIQEKPVHRISDLVAAYTQGGAQMMKDDPAGPRFVVNLFDPGDARPTLRKSFQCSCLKITRTYSLSAIPTRYAASGVVVRNNVFTDLPSSETLGPWSIEETVSTEVEAWRRGYYDKPRSWELAGPQAGDINEVTRKYSSQKSFKTDSMPSPKRSLEERLSARARTLSKQARKKRRMDRAMRTQESSTSSSTSSSSSDSEARDK